MDDSTPEELDRLREGVRRIVGDEFIGKFRDGDFLLLLSERFADEKDLRAATSDQLRSIKLPAALIAHLKKGPEADLPLEEYLQRYHGVKTVREYVYRQYKEAYEKARPALLGYKGRLPSFLRSLEHPFVREVLGHDGKLHKVELGRQVELICRNHTVRAAIFFFAKIERNFLSSSGNDTGLTRSVALMALIGAPGTGKTTILTELVHMIREHIKSHPEDCLSIIQHATGQHDIASAERTLARLRQSVREGSELVIWLRLDKNPSLLSLEKEGSGPENTLALRLLYGCLTYFDSLGGTPPAGTYEQFLYGLDRRVRAALVPDDAFAFLDMVTGQPPGTSRAAFVFVDEVNAATGPYPGDVPTGEDSPERNWAQRILSTLIQYTDDQRTKDRLIVAVLGTSRHSVATLAGTATPRSEIAPLPLNSPLLHDIQHLLKGIWGRLLQTTGGMELPMELPCEIAEDEDSVVVQLALWAGGNFRLMSWMLELFGGAKTVYDHESWQPEGLMDWLSAKRGCTAVRSVRSVLEALHGGMEGQGWFEKLGALDNPIKLAILEQAIAHARTGVTVQLRAPVLKEHPKITYGHLLNEGLIQPVFLVEITEDDRKSRSVVRVAESPVRAPIVEARGSKAWHDSDRHGELPGQAPASTGGPGLQSPATPAPGAAGEAAPAKTSPVLETATALGFRRVIDASANLSAADITIELAPAVLAGLWRRLGGLDLSPLAETVYQESPGKKELVDLFCMMDPMRLRRKVFGMISCRMVEVVRADWLPPWAAKLRVSLPEPRTLESIAHFKGQLEPESFPGVRDLARAAIQYKDGDSWRELEQQAQLANLTRPSLGVSAADNFGIDTLLFLKLWRRVELSEDFLDLFVQSKYSRGTTTQTFPFALTQCEKDTSRHNITAGEAPRVAELNGPEEPCPSKRATPQRAAAAKGEQQRRQDPEHGYFGGGSMDMFVQAVMAAPEAFLKAWEEQLEERQIQPPHCPHPFLYCFVTDHEMLPIQHTRLRVLSLAGHPYASRMVFIDRNQQKTFYGVSIAIQRALAKLQEHFAD